MNHHGDSVARSRLAVFHGAEPRLHQLIGRVKRRSWMLAGSQGTCWGLLGGLMTIVAAMWIDLVWELPPTLRAATWGGATLVLLAVLTRAFAAAWYAMEARRIARLIDLASHAGGELLNGFEFAANREHPSWGRSSGSPPNPLTSGLAEMAIERAAALAEQVRVTNVVSAVPAVAAARWLGGLLAIVVLFVLFFPTLARTQWQRFTHPWEETPPYSPIEIVVEPGDTSIVYGKSLDVRVKLGEQAARQVRLVVKTDDDVEEVPMFPEGDGTWRTQLSRLTKNATYWARVDRARSASYHIQIITTPAIEEVQFTVIPPPYTHEAPYRGPLPNAGLVGLKGTRVQIVARSNRPLSAGEIRIKSEGTTTIVALQPPQPGDVTVTGEFTILRTAKFELQVSDTDRQPSQELFHGSMTRLIDERPLVRILEPKPQSFATPTSRLPIVVESEDDYGVAQLELHRSLNDSRPLVMSLPLPEPAPRRHRSDHLLALDRYGLQEGDEIKLFARVTDNEPESPQSAESTVVIVRIISQSEFEQMLRVREGLEVLISKYRQAERRLETLQSEIAAIQKELEELPPDSPAAQQLMERLEKLAEELGEQAEVMKKAGEHELPYDLDHNLKKQLEDLAEQLQQQSDELQQLVQRQQSDGMTNEAVQRQLNKLSQNLGERRMQLAQEANEPLELLAKVFPLIECQSRFVQLVLWQVDLAERLATFKDIERSDDPKDRARLRDLQDEQRRIREELAKLLDDVENHVRELPDDEQFDELRESATKFATEVRASGATEEMTDAETALADFRGGEGYGHALAAAEILKRFLSESSGMGQAGQSCLRFNPGLSESLGGTIGQLLREAGLGAGSTAGGGQGGGFSMRSNRGNFGLYGSLDALGGRANSGQGTGQSNTPGAGQSGSGDASAGVTDPESMPWQRSASSSNTSLVPPQYRRRVGKYFQRVADDLEAASK